MPHAADRIRNVALVGHRGSGKTSLHEALLFEAGATNRLGSVADGTTVSDSDEDEQARGMSISAALASFEWTGRQGQPDRHARRALVHRRRARRAARVRVGRVRGQRRDGRRGLARSGCGSAPPSSAWRGSIYVNMLDRERADFFRTLDSLKAAFGPHVVATEIPIGSEHEVRGLIDLVDMKAYEYAGTGRENCKECPIPDDMADLAQEYREKLMDEVAENSDALMERYLEGEEISHEEIVTALEDGTDHGHIFPVTCGVATQHLGADRLLDAIVDDLPSPVQHGGARARGHDARAGPRRRDVRLRVQDPRRPVRGPHQPLPRLPGHGQRTTRRCSTRAPTTRSASASCWCRRARRSATPTRSARATSARWPSSRRRARATGSPRATSRSRCRRSSSRRRSWRSRSSRRPRATRTRSSPRCAACRRRTRRSTCTATTRPASRSWPGCRRSTSR